MACLAKHPKYITGNNRGEEADVDDVEDVIAEEMDEDVMAEVEDDIFDQYDEGALLSDSDDEGGYYMSDSKMSKMYSRNMEKDGKSE
jgi:hypothetical protein